MYHNIKELALGNIMLSAFYLSESMVLIYTHAGTPKREYYICILKKGRNDDFILS